MTSTAYAQLSSPNLSIPSVQWIPPGEFPYELDEFARIGRSRVAKDHGLNEHQLCLMRMEFSRFVPSEAVEAKGLNLLDHLNHWIAEMKFTADGRDYFAYVFLDGTVVQTEK